MVLVVLLVANLMSNRVLPNWAYVPWNVGVAALITFLAVGAATWSELGMVESRRGLLWGAVLFVLTTGVLLLALTMPAFNDMYHDRRVTGDSVDWVYQAFVRIPLGTALLEEVTFRAVLPALFAHRWGVLHGSVLGVTVLRFLARAAHAQPQRGEPDRDEGVRHGRRGSARRSGVRCGRHGDRRIVVVLDPLSRPPQRAGHDHRPHHLQLGGVHDHLHGRQLTAAR